MDPRTAEDIADHIEDSVCDELDVDSIAEVLSEAERLRVKLTRAFREECSVDDVFVGSGGIETKAYWGWESVIHTTGVVFASKMEITITDDTAEYSVTFFRVDGERKIHLERRDGEGPAHQAAQRAFALFHLMLKELADES